VAATKGRGRVWVWATLAAGAMALACGGEQSAPQATTPCTEGVSPAAADSLSLEEAQRQTPFPIAYPCRLPTGFRLQRVLVEGSAEGSRSVTLVFGRPGFDTTLELTESQREPGFTVVPPAMTLTRPTVQGVVGRLMEGDSGTGHYLLYLAWSKGGVSYELQGTVGAGLTRQGFLPIAESIR